MIRAGMISEGSAPSPLLQLSGEVTMLTTQPGCLFLSHTSPWPSTLHLTGTEGCLRQYTKCETVAAEGQA